MIYRECLEWLYNRLPAFQRIGGAAYKANLDNTHALMELLGHPEDSFPAVHIAGTNGKGSSSHLLASVLQEAGYRTGLYTSPHLLDYTERIRVNGVPVTEEFVVSFVEKYQGDFLRIGLSFFEMSVGMAFAWFREQQVDLAVVEVGMGGRLDSTNVVHPEVCLITNIGWDHQQFLGNTLKAIAGEKAGIMKPGVPVVISEYQEEVAEVFRERGTQLGSPVIFAPDQELPDLPSALNGGYQARNKRGVLATLRELHRFPVTDEQISRGFSRVLENTGLRGRWEQLNQSPPAFADTAHNVDGIAALLEHISTFPHSTLHLVWGMVGDKPATPVLGLLPKTAKYYFCAPDIPRAKRVEDLAEEAAGMGLKGSVFQSAGAAYRKALATAKPEDLVVVTGSTFVVADLLKEISG